MDTNIIMTEVGKPMVYDKLTVTEPVRPEDATHVGPAGDYWRVDLDHDVMTALAHVWDGQRWHLARELFAEGLVMLGLTFKGLEGKPDISVDIMLQRFEERAEAAGPDSPEASILRLARAAFQRRKASQN